MLLKIIFHLSCVLLFLQSLSANDMSEMRSITFNVGYSLSTQEQERWMLDGHLGMSIFNASVDTGYCGGVSEDVFLSRAYLGLGFIQYIEAQRGWGDLGNSWRLRSIFCPRELYGLYPSGKLFSFRGGPAISLTVDRFDTGFTRYGVLVGMVF